MNNSNDLFLTFRKEMEEMSKKTKRLEKENHNLERKQAATSKNVLEMAEERAKASKEIELLRKKNANLEKLCRGMQQQGRGQLPAPIVDRQNVELDSEGTESEYEDEYEDEEEEDGEYDDDTEEETSPRQGPQNLHGTAPLPPPLQSAATVAGAQSNHKVNGTGQVNGVKH